MNSKQFRVQTNMVSLSEERINQLRRNLCNSPNGTQNLINYHPQNDDLKFRDFDSINTRQPQQPPPSTSLTSSSSSSIIKALNENNSLNMNNQNRIFNHQNQMNSKSLFNGSWRKNSSSTIIRSFEPIVLSQINQINELDDGEKLINHLIKYELAHKQDLDNITQSNISFN